MITLLLLIFSIVSFKLIINQFKDYSKQVDNKFRDINHQIILVENALCRYHDRVHKIMLNDSVAYDTSTEMELYYLKKKIERVENWLTILKQKKATRA